MSRIEYTITHKIFAPRSYLITAKLLDHRGDVIHAVATEMPSSVSFTEAAGRLQARLEAEAMDNVHADRLSRRIKQNDRR